MPDNFAKCFPRAGVVRLNRAEVLIGPIEQDYKVRLFQTAIMNLMPTFAPGSLAKFKNFLATGGIAV